MHAASGYYCLNFDVSGPVTISVRAATNGYWSRGVEIQPMRLGLRPIRHGRTITFRLTGPAKVSIARPGDHFADAEMLFLFANAPETSGITPATAAVRYYKPGVYHENIDAHTGDTIYIASGAVIFGALNLWQVENVHVLGAGTIIYDGPQDPTTDQGWMHRPNWHAIVMDNAHNIEIDGITCIVRSRTWQIQMRDSRHIGFYNIKVIGGSPSDANQDGMDWLGGGDTTVRNSFFRASDDVFALQGNWEGYSEAAMLTPGHDVSNITIEDSVVSTSISNIVRVGWPQKIFNSYHFRMRNMDVLHTGFGSCKVPFALFEMWADPAGKGTHADYQLEDIRLEDWYSLLQIRQPNPRIRGISFTGIWALNGPGMAPSVLSGDIKDVTFTNVSTIGAIAMRDNDVPLEERNGAAPPEYRATAHLAAAFTYSLGLIRPSQPVTFSAPASSGVAFHWFFGDGREADGPTVKHAFPDADGTLLDGSGRFRVLLRTEDAHGHTTWMGQPVVVARSLYSAEQNAGSALHPGLSHRVATAGSEGAPQVYEGFLRIPADAGYAFTLLSSGSGKLQIDGRSLLRSPRPRALVCGTPGYAVQPATGSMALAAGLHRVRLQVQQQDGNSVPPLLWQGPGVALSKIPVAAYFH